MLNFMLWAAIVVGLLAALPINPGLVVMLAAFIALGTTTYLVDRVKK